MELIRWIDSKGIQVLAKCQQRQRGRPCRPVVSIGARLHESSEQARIAHQVVLAARARGVIVRPLGDTLIMLPPLSISQEELETLVDVVQAAIKEVTEHS